ncbi:MULTISPECIES: hypothetical protein [Pseudomonas]|uniref:Uncharacterized protein n=1 Tax=Pseudomonas nitroreducens TaxID=46680 RepID=A0A6G6J714_PSENT|nr:MULTISPECIES: hypothetical protein [Pseudomonas]QIE91119.1 hypothetical protein G5B91_32705 [Pseudomonas nitroreducens]UCL90267.1 hypothetical protein LDJ84_30300 [Pseudomonas sp. HS-18]
MEKIDFERSILEIARPALKIIYGNFEDDLSQTDKPDAAILLDKNNGAGKKLRIGIEITTVDKGKDLQYFNDEKHGKDLVQEDLLKCIESNTPSSRPTKRADITIEKEYIFEGVKKKSARFKEYEKEGEFDEIILLCFSDYIDLRNPEVNPGLLLWTDYLLSSESFPFERVIFVSTLTRASVMIYNKSEPLAKRPSEDAFCSYTTTPSMGGFIPMGEHNISGILNADPLIPPKSKK